MNQLSPIEDAAGGNEPRSQVTTYLRALQVTSPQQQERIVQRVLDEITRKQVGNLEASATTLAMDELHRQMNEWFTRLMGSRGHVVATGMVLFIAIDAPRQWPDIFLEDDLPADFQMAFRQSVVVWGAPGLSVTSMVPQPFENPLPEKIPLPAPLAELTRELSPVMAKLLSFILVVFFVWPGTRPK